jgi:integrase
MKELVGYLAMSIAALSQLPFTEACEGWLETRRPYISAKTAHEYRLNIYTLAKFFGEMRLTEIDADMIRSYQRMRMAKCGPHSINHECSVLQQVLKRIGKWEDIGRGYQPLPLPKARRGRAITDQEREKLFRIMRLNPNWDAARLCATICINTTASPGTAYKLKLADVDLSHRILKLGMNGAKNDGRIRPIPMNEELVEACLEALARAKILGAYKPEHYLFPFRACGQEHDPLRHQVTFKTAWIKILAEAKRHGLDLEGLRLEDMRHSAITALLENPNVSEETAQRLAGHIDEKMKRFYSHVRIEAKRQAVEALALNPKKPVSVENSTEAQDNRALAAQLIALASKLLNSA